MFNVVCWMVKSHSILILIVEWSTLCVEGLKDIQFLVESTLRVEWTFNFEWTLRVEWTFNSIFQLCVEGLKDNVPTLCWMVKRHSIYSWINFESLDIQFESTLRVHSILVECSTWKVKRHSILIVESTLRVGMHIQV